mmetsp:Transcript_32413/g.112113  ORF Transcript_32413/g.112113 Transcript_32413/m.112113 type:complete len:251 (+) Transcript_32413:26-778(+)
MVIDRGARSAPSAHIYINERARRGQSSRGVIHPCQRPGVWEGLLFPGFTVVGRARAARRSHRRELRLEGAPSCTLRGAAGAPPSGGIRRRRGFEDDDWCRHDFVVSGRRRSCGRRGRRRGRRLSCRGWRLRLAFRGCVARRRRLGLRRLRLEDRGLDRLAELVVVVVVLLVSVRSCSRRAAHARFIPPSSLALLQRGPHGLEDHELLDVVQVDAAGATGSERIEEVVQVHVEHRVSRHLASRAPVRAPAR